MFTQRSLDKILNHVYLAEVVFVHQIAHLMMFCSAVFVFALINMINVSLIDL